MIKFFGGFEKYVFALKVQIIIDGGKTRAVRNKESLSIFNFTFSPCNVLFVFSLRFFPPTF